MIDAENGDWLARHVLGPDPKIKASRRGEAERLFDLAVEEERGLTVENKIRNLIAAAEQESSMPLGQLLKLL